MESGEILKSVLESLRIGREIQAGAKEATRSSIQIDMGESLEKVRLDASQYSQEAAEIEREIATYETRWVPDVLTPALVGAAVYAAVYVAYSITREKGNGRNRRRR